MSYVQLKCDCCNVEFNDRKSFTDHQSLIREIEILNGNMPSQSAEPPQAQSVFMCDECQKSYKTKYNLSVHVRAVHRGITYPCTKCGNLFKYINNKTKHEKTCQGTEHDCHICSKKCSTARGLRMHLHTHKDQTEQQQLTSLPLPSKRKRESSSTSVGKRPKKDTQPSAYCCRRCNRHFQDRRELYLHGMKEHFQSGGGLQSFPWKDGPPPWQHSDKPDNEDLRDVYEANAPIILEKHRKGPVKSVYNFPIDNDFTLHQLRQHINEIYDDQHHAFRLNLAFGVILQNRENQKYRYYTPFSNSAVFDSPMSISKRSDIKGVQQSMETKDFPTELLRNRPNTKWIAVLLCNVQYDVTSTNYPIGVGAIPDYLLRKRSIQALVKNQRTGRPYDDDLCAFRCLALHRGFHIKCLETPTLQYYRQWRKSCNARTDNFSGICIEDFPNFENLFKVNLEVYKLNSDGSAYSIYKSRALNDSTMYVNLYENHFSYIKDFSSYAKKYQCTSCERHFRTSNRLTRHQEICKKRTKYVHPGGFFTPYETVFEKLEQFGISVPSDERTFPWFICYDFEAMLQKVDEQQTEYLKWIHKHIPISISICSNVEGHTQPFCVVESDPNQLVEYMICAMREIAQVVSELSEDKWGWVLEEIKEKIKKNGMNLSDTREQEQGNDDIQKDVKCKPLENLYREFSTYMTQVPVLGFNSAKYDLNLIKQYFAKHLMLHDAEGKFVVKKNNSYLCIATKELKFLDVSQFLAAGSSYAQFLKAYQVQESKGFFPYEWFDDISKLDANELPQHEAFFSKLKNCNISEEEYDFCQSVWKEYDMNTFRDFLMWYNNLDVGPFVTAVTRMQQFYFNRGLDLFKTALSIPGIARQMLFKSAKENQCNFALFDNRNADLYNTIKRNIVGGPSIIFNRHLQAGKKCIRGENMCGSIIGLDATSLYLYCMGKHLPVGPFVRRRLENGFKAELRDRFMMCTYWLDWLNISEGHTILHKQNHGYEIRIGNYPVDGFRYPTKSEDRPTIYEFLGCYYHFHDCELTRHVKDKKWIDRREKNLKKTQQRTKFLRENGYNVIEMWECEFRSYCKKNPAIYEFIDSKRPDFFRKYRFKKVTEVNILQSVVDGLLFGMVEVDIEVPKEWPEYFKRTDLTPYQYFEEMAPLFCSTDVPFNAIGVHMQQHVLKHNLSTSSRRLLIGGMAGRQMLIATPLLKWYLEHGMIVTRIYQVVEFRGERCFKEFVQEVSDARRAGDSDPNSSIIANTVKVIGNSSYGSMIMDKTKHRLIKYVQGENETGLLVNEPRFRKLECLDQEHQYYEIELAKKKISLDLPHQLGYFVLQYAKLRMLELYYDFMDKYVDRRNFQYAEMDTDSAYFAISGKSLADVIKPSMKENYEKGLKNFCSDNQIEADCGYHWFPRTCCSKHCIFDKRTPGLFHIEYQGDEIIGLCSKTYILRKMTVDRTIASRTAAYRILRRSIGLKKRKSAHPSSRRHNKHEKKFASKGVSKRSVKQPMSIFRRVLRTGKKQSGINFGIRAKDNTVFTYSQEKRAFSYFYCKRKVMTDGISTRPLDIVLCPTEAQ